MVTIGTLLRTGGIAALLVLLAAVPLHATSSIEVPNAAPETDVLVQEHWQVWAAVGSRVQWQLPEGMRIKMPEPGEWPEMGNGSWQQLHFGWQIPWTEPGLIEVVLGWKVSGAAAIVRTLSDGTRLLWAEEGGGFYWEEDRLIAPGEWHLLSESQQIFWEDTAIWPPDSAVTTAVQTEDASREPLQGALSPEVLHPGAKFTWSLQFPAGFDASKAQLNWPSWAALTSYGWAGASQEGSNRQQLDLVVPAHGGKLTLAFVMLLRPELRSGKFTAQWQGQTYSLQPVLRFGVEHPRQSWTKASELDEEVQAIPKHWLHSDAEMNPLAPTFPTSGVDLHWSESDELQVRVAAPLADNGRLQWQWKDDTMAIFAQQGSWLWSQAPQEWQFRWDFGRAAEVTQDGGWYWWRQDQRWLSRWQGSANQWQLQWDSEAAQLENITWQYSRWRSYWRPSDHSIGTAVTIGQYGRLFLQKRAGWDLGWQAATHDLLISQKGGLLSVSGQIGGRERHVRFYFCEGHSNPRWSLLTTVAGWQWQWTSQGNDWLASLSGSWEDQFGRWRLTNHWAGIDGYSSSWSGLRYYWDSSSWHGVLGLETAHTGGFRFWDGTVGLGWQSEQGWTVSCSYHSRDGLAVGVSLQPW